MQSAQIDKIKDTNIKLHLRLITYTDLSLLSLNELDDWATKGLIQNKHLLSPNKVNN